MRHFSDLCCRLSGVNLVNAKQAYFNAKYWKSDSIVVKYTNAVLIQRFEINRAINLSIFHEHCTKSQGCRWSSL